MLGYDELCFFLPFYHLIMKQVGVCCERLLHLLESWGVGGKHRKPWCLLDALRVDVRNGGFMIWTRAQILRLNSACRRRYDRRFGCWPYPLYAIPHINDFGEGHVNSVIERLLRATRRELDVYSLGVRTKHPSRESLMSAQCMHLLSVDFEMHTYGIDFVERLNSTLTRGGSKHGPGRSFVQHAREFLLGQARDVHMSRGGLDPLKPQTLDSEDLDIEEVSHPPFLAQPRSTRDTPHLAILDAPGSARPAGGEARPEEEISSHAGSFEEAIIVRRPALVSPSGGEAATAKQQDAGKKASGLSPYMLEFNKHLANTKKALGRKNDPRRNERSQGEFQALVRQPRGQLQLRRGLRLVDAVWH